MKDWNQFIEDKVLVVLFWVPEHTCTAVCTRMLL